MDTCENIPSEITEMPVRVITSASFMSMWFGFLNIWMSRSEENSNYKKESRVIVNYGC